ncbi:cyclophilin [Perkinsela sp. CCAP 1560/4]|nr:cyclophilin [Perkinsela sp. CCAP 1560/4]|eukprot:KNH05284.1 cyclophilin [Perkinsela sp. CCAP 1560/4]
MRLSQIASLRGTHTQLWLSTTFLYQKRRVTPFFSYHKNSKEGEKALLRKDEITQAPEDWSVVPLRFLPLSLIEEFIAPQVAPSAIELITTAWTEERAQRLRNLKFLSHAVFAFSCLLFFVVAYSVTIAAENKIRGRDTMPKELKIGAVVYLDVSENGTEPRRITIGLLTHVCPIYCEYFHRMCCGLANNNSFRGQTVGSTLPGVAVLFGDGQSAQTNVPDFDSCSLPREDFSSGGSWRGAVSSVPFTRARQSGNFCFHMTVSKHAPQVFGIVLGGYEVIERISFVGTSHGSLPRRDFEIVSCGELCTLDPLRVTPIPWDTYSGISPGFNTDSVNAVV